MAQNNDVLYQSGSSHSEEIKKVCDESVGSDSFVEGIRSPFSQSDSEGFLSAQNQQGLIVSGIASPEQSYQPKFFCNDSIFNDADVECQMFGFCQQTIFPQKQAIIHWLQNNIGRKRFNWILSNAIKRICEIYKVAAGHSGSLHQKDLQSVQIMAGNIPCLDAPSKQPQTQQDQLHAEYSHEHGRPLQEEQAHCEETHNYLQESC